LSVAIFLRNPPAHFGAFAQSWDEFKHFVAGEIGVQTFAAIYEQQFLLPRYCVVGDLIKFCFFARQNK